MSWSVHMFSLMHMDASYSQHAPKCLTLLCNATLAYCVVLWTSNWALFQCSIWQPGLQSGFLELARVCQFCRYMRGAWSIDSHGFISPGWRVGAPFSAGLFRTLILHSFQWELFSSYFKILLLWAGIFLGSSAPDEEAGFLTEKHSFCIC